MHIPTPRWLVFAPLAIAAAAHGDAAADPGSTAAPPAPASAIKPGSPTSAPTTGPAPRGKRAWRFRSDQHAVALLELFTSQESSSCSPVDRMVSNLPRDGLGFDKVVPLCYHVSHWPHLGWTDTFSVPEFKQRQMFYVLMNRLDGPYAPQVVLNGRDFPERGDALYETIREINARPLPIKLSLLIEMAPDRRSIDVYGQGDRSTTFVSDPRALIARVVVFEMGLSASVQKGENAGKTLPSDYVVRLVSPEHAFKPTDHILETGDTNLRLDRRWIADRLGVAAFVQSPDDGAVIQAVGGLLDPARAEFVQD